MDQISHALRKPCFCSAGQRHPFSDALKAPFSRRFLGFSASVIARTPQEVSQAERAFESLSFLFAGFLGFAASAQAAN
ncbi:hypothetical protein [Mesorhizobium cantuariense]|uniref:Uncharacterized protein n=1 Tax=Mesorhizobium cantuariense TaxID=1300275 RepID=A0ABV7MIW5_9HYPH